MREIPKVSVFANRLGKVRKSTAKIAKIVTNIFPPNKCNIQNEKKSIKNRIIDEEHNIYKYIKILIKSIEQMTQMISIFWIEILSKSEF